MLYRTEDFTRWGSSLGRDLTGGEVDGNFWELRKALNDLIANPGLPVSIASVTAVGNRLTFNMSDGSTIGPISLPVMAFRWRDVWTPSTTYSQMDIFKVVGVGLYMVTEDHVSPAGAFNPSYLVPADSSLAYLQLFAFATPQNLIYDVGFSYPGLLSSLGSDVTYMYQEPFPRQVLLPTVPFAGSAHQAYLQTVSTVSAQDFTIYKNGMSAGTIHFAIGAHVGTVTITADTTFAIGDRLAVSKPAVVDPAAAGISVVFGAQQIVV